MTETTTSPTINPTTTADASSESYEDVVARLRTNAQRFDGELIASSEVSEKEIKTEKESDAEKEVKLDAKDEHDEDAIDPRGEDGKKNVKIKVDGKVRTVPLKALAESYQIRQDLDRKRTEVGAQLERVRQFGERVEREPAALFETLETIHGEQRAIDAAIEYLENHTKRARMTPEERALRERAARADKLDREAKTRETDELRTREEAALARAEQRASKRIVSSFAAAARDAGEDIEATPALVRLAATEMEAALRRGENMDAEEAMRWAIAQLDPIVSRRAQKTRKEDITKVREKQRAAPTPPREAASAPEETGTDLNTVRARLRKQLRSM